MASSTDSSTPNWQHWLARAQCQAWQTQGGALRMARPFSPHVNEELTEILRNPQTRILHGWRHR